MAARRILIVEDEDVLAENLKTFLGRSSPDVRTAPDGERALAMLDSFTPDVVVMDLALPGIDGLDAYSEIVRRRGRRVACVMITGHALEGIAASACARGIRHLLCKPFSLADLQLQVDASARESGDDPYTPYGGAPG
jgi:DNA-binding response OmpR family regulator